MDLIFHKNQIQQAVQSFLKEGSKKKVIAFYAPMGAGKTTLITAICNEMGVKSALYSPTFSIMDLYRLKNEEEAIQAGVEDALMSGNLCFVEWPEKAEGLLPDGALHVCIEVLDDETRRIFTPSLQEKD
jgi:tRNA threonylcarbamoyladenosine biosynthesis protein TsaE